MKTFKIHIAKYLFILLTLLALNNARSFAQGRVVINEFMPWSGCATTNEFVELLNFGPGPMNIGCYIVTNGQYAVTIPANTVLQPGQYFVISGSDSLTMPCGNVDSTIKVDLNWTTCNCSDKAVPTTGDGFFQNGGSSNEKVVLLSPTLQVLDAVSRSATPSASVSITTSTASGGCTQKTFNLGTMTISYEAIGISAGIDNSFARRVDGDCGWVKTTSISADAPNKTGSTSSATYDFSTLSASECSGSTGSISITVTAADVAALFPMTYTLAYDTDSNGLFNNNDLYTFGVDSSSPDINISNLAYGRYKITVGSVSGCNLKSFDFFIFNCYGVVLPYKIVTFQFEKTTAGRDYFYTSISGAQHLQKIMLEGGDGRQFKVISTLTDIEPKENQQLRIDIPQSFFSHFRLKLIDHNNVVSYSNEIRIERHMNKEAMLWPNPSRGDVYIKLNSPKYAKTSYRLYNSSGHLVRNVNIDVKAGLNTILISANGLQKGIYQVFIDDPLLQADSRFRFIKQ